MTDISATGPIADSRTQPKTPRCSLDATIGAIARAVAEAFHMAYVAPYQTSRRPPHAFTQTEDGRDPAW
jgi:hypothetical protein